MVFFKFYYRYLFCPKPFVTFNIAVENIHDATHRCSVYLNPVFQPLPPLCDEMEWGTHLALQKQTQIPIFNSLVLTSSIKYPFKRNV